MSKHLSASQIRAIEKIGDSMIPGEGEFPSFSSSGCSRHVDRIADYMPAGDLKDLKMLLSILAVFPLFLVALMVRFLEWGATWPGPIGAQIRFIRLGLRGLILSLYYGDSAITDKVGYRVSVFKG
jgi:hypothetical protein